MCQMHSPSDILRFVTAGRATFTLSSKRTGARYTFRASQAKNRDDRFFVSLLTGQDNEGDYSYIGTMDGTAFRTTSKSHLPDGSTPVRAVKFFCDHVLSRGEDPETLDLEVRHEGRCGRCARLLTVPESIDRGIGPECAQVMGL